MVPRRAREPLSRPSATAGRAAPSRGRAHGGPIVVGRSCGAVAGVYWPGAGTWRSLVAHLLWEQGVGGSSPPVPTTPCVRTRIIPWPGSTSARGGAISGARTASKGPYDTTTCASLGPSHRLQAFKHCVAAACAALDSPASFSRGRAKGKPAGTLYVVKRWTGRSVRCPHGVATGRRGCSRRCRRGRVRS